MNDRQLTSFIKIVETGSFSKAAKESFISVPAMVQQMDRLEESLGSRLFLRNNHGVILTEQGKIFYEAARKIQGIYEEAVVQIKSGEETDIHIGVASNQCPEFLIEACAACQKKQPGLAIHLTELPYEQHLEMIQKRTIDLTVIAKPKDSYIKDLEYLELYEDTCCFGVNEESPLAQKAYIQSRELEGVKILCGTYSYMETSFEELLKDTGANLQSLHAEYNLESRAQVKFSDSVLVFHSLWKNCYSHMFRVIPSQIQAGSIGVLVRKGEKRKYEKLILEMKNIIDKTKTAEAK